MKTLSDIRKDLKNIKYYYSRKTLLDKAFNDTVVNDILEIVAKYNDAVKKATPRLFDTYYSLYVYNHTQESYSMELGCSPEYVQRLNKQLLEFLQMQLAEI